MAVLGRRPQKFTLPPDHTTWIELRKLSGPEKADYRELLGGSAVVSLKYLWDHAVVGFRLESDQGPVNWPDERHPELKQAVFEGLEDDEYNYLQAAAWVHNEILRSDLTRGFDALLKVGTAALPDCVIAMISDWSAPVTAEAVAAICEILGDKDPGDVLGNADGLSGMNGPGEPAPPQGDPGPETRTAAPESL